MSTLTPALLAGLDGAVIMYLCPFMQKIGALHSVGQSNLDGWPGPSSLKKRKHAELGGVLFWWVNRFVVDTVTLDIGYGERELLVEPMLYYEGIKDRFSPWEVLSAANVPNPNGASGEAWVLSVAFMQKVICNVSNGIIANWQLLSSPPPEIIDRCRVIRGKRMIFAQEEQRRQDREKACIKASAAFHAGNFVEAVRQIEPYRDDKDLPRSSSVLLAMAERR